MIPTWQGTREKTEEGRAYLYFWLTHLPWKQKNKQTLPTQLAKKAVRGVDPAPPGRHVRGGINLSHRFFGKLDTYFTELPNMKGVYDSGAMPFQPTSLILLPKWRPSFPLAQRERAACAWPWGTYGKDKWIIGSESIVGTCVTYGRNVLYITLGRGGDQGQTWPGLADWDNLRRFLRCCLAYVSLRWPVTTTRQSARLFQSASPGGDGGIKL